MTEMPVESVEHGLALLALNELVPEDITPLALLMVEDGCSVSVIAALASATPSDDPREKHDAFLAAVNTSAYRLPTRKDATRTLLRVAAARALAGGRPFYDVAYEIIKIYEHVGPALHERCSELEQELGVSCVIDLYYDYDEVWDDPVARQELDTQLITALRSLAAYGCD